MLGRVTVAREILVRVARLQRGESAQVLRGRGAWRGGESRPVLLGWGSLEPGALLFGFAVAAPKGKVLLVVGEAGKEPDRSFFA